MCLSNTVTCAACGLCRSDGTPPSTSGARVWFDQVPSDVPGNLVLAVHWTGFYDGEQTRAASGAYLPSLSYSISIGREFSPTVYLDATPVNTTVSGAWGKGWGGCG
jgi:hypothetical protein